MANKLNLICGSNQPCLVQVLEYQLHVDVRYSKTHTLAKFAIGNGALWLVESILAPKFKIQTVQLESRWRGWWNVWTVLDYPISYSKSMKCVSCATEEAVEKNKITNLAFWNSCFLQFCELFSHFRSYVIFPLIAYLNFLLVMLK